MHRYFYLYKPYLMLTQFTPQEKKQTLADLEFRFPKDAYPVGRLDADSEGLLLLTNDTTVNSRLLNPQKKHGRVYLVQVEGEGDENACRKLGQGVSIRVGDESYRTQPCKAELIAEPGWLPPRNPPIRFRKSIPVSWLRLTLTEGKNRQVRKMTAAVGFPTLRLIRESIAGISIEGLHPGDVREISRKEFYEKLGI